MKNLNFLSMLLILGCASTPAVNEALLEDTISGASMNCKEPYMLTQDCSNWSGAKRKTKIEGFEVKIASSSAGDVVFIMDAHLFANAFKEGITMNLVKDYQSAAANNSFEAVKKILQENNIEITRVRPVVTMGRINGYVLELKGDGYSILSEYTI